MSKLHDDIEEVRVVRWHTQDGIRHPLILGRAPDGKRLELVEMDSGGLALRRIDPVQERYMTPLDYPVHRAAKKYLKALRAFGGSDKLKRRLKELCSR